eukprot:Opistho-1_new@101778
MNAFVDIPEEEQALELATYMGTLSESLSGLEAQAKQLLAEGGLTKLLVRLIESGEVLFAAPGEVEGPINTLTCLVRKARAEDAVALYKSLARVIASNASDRPLMRLKLLTNLFNNVSVRSPARYDIYYALIDLAGSCGRVDAILSEFAELSRWLDEWHASVEQRRALYKLIHRVLVDNSRRAEAQEFMVKYLSTFEKGDAEGLKGARSDASACVVAAIAEPSMFQLESLLNLPAVQQLEGELVHKLLKIFVFDGIEAYDKLYAENADAIAKLGLSHSDCTDKMRLLTLASISSDVTELKYSTVAETMRINRDEVEEWIIRAIGTGLLEARLDQLNERVLISRSTHRTFNRAQWEYLKQRLGAWQTAMVDVFQVIRNARAQAHAALAKQQAGSA